MRNSRVCEDEIVWYRGMELAILRRLRLTLFSCYILTQSISVLCYSDVFVIICTA
jgi:hypothetical protein